MAWFDRKSRPKSKPGATSKPEAGPEAEAAESRGEEPAASARATEDLADEAMDALAGVLRAYGVGAFDLDDVDAPFVADTCETWARHVLLGTPEPHSRVGETGAAPAAPTRRNWVGVQRFVVDHRGREKAYVAATLDDLQQAIWAFVGSLSRTLVAERDDEGDVETQLVKIRGAIERNDHGAIREAALATAEIVQRNISARRERQAQELEAIGAQLEELGGKLAPQVEGGGLADEPVLEQHMHRVVDLGTVFERTGYLIIVEADDLDWLRNQHGSEAADAVSEALAGVVQELFPRPEQVAARWGTARFAVVLLDLTFSDAQMQAERLLQAVRDLEIELRSETLRVTASAALAPMVKGENRKDWLDRGMGALARAQETGGDRYSVELPETEQPR